MNAVAMLIPILFIVAFAYAGIKKVKVFDSFVSGVKKAPPLILSVFPYTACVFIMTELFEQSGLFGRVVAFLSPALSLLGIPKEAVKLLVVKPFSGSGATAVLSDIISSCGADSYAARCACVCYSSCETVFYIAAVYFSGTKPKKLFLPVGIALFSFLLSCVFGCFILRFL